VLETVGDCALPVNCGPCRVPVVGQRQRPVLPLSWTCCCRNMQHVARANSMYPGIDGATSWNVAKREVLGERNSVDLDSQDRAKRLQLRREVEALASKRVEERLLAKPVTCKKHRAS